MVDLLRFDPNSIDEDDIEWDELTPESMQLFVALADYPGIEVPSARAQLGSLRPRG